MLTSPWALIRARARSPGRQLVGEDTGLAADHRIMLVDGGASGFNEGRAMGKSSSKRDRQIQKRGPGRLERLRGEQGRRAERQARQRKKFKPRPEAQTLMTTAPRQRRGTDLLSQLLGRPQK